MTRTAFAIRCSAGALVLSLVIGTCSGCGGAGTVSPVPFPQPLPSSGTPGPSGGPTPSPTVPPNTIYATLFSAISPLVNNFSSSVAAACPTSQTSAKVYAELLPANANYVFTTLPGESAGQVTAAANSAVSYAQNLQQRFGIKGVTIAIDYPVLVANPANLPNANMTTANYALFDSYYKQVATGIRGLGLGLDVETNIVFPTLLGQTSAYYAGLTVPMLENGVAEVAQHVIDDVKPDRVNLATEPATIAYNTALAQINSPSGYASFVGAIRAQVNTANSPTTQLGAGSDDWQSPSFMTTLESSGTPLDYYDLHLYPPDYLQTGITMLQQLQATSKPIVITEDWLNKQAQSVDGPGQPAPQVTELRNGYSFWGDLDAQYITSMMRLASCTNVRSVSFFSVNQFYSYVDYNATTASYSYTQMQQALNAARLAAIASGAVSPAGYAIQQYDGLAPASAFRGLVRH